MDQGYLHSMYHEPRIISNSIQKTLLEIFELVSPSIPPVENKRVYSHFTQPSKLGNINIYSDWSYCTGTFAYNKIDIENRPGVKVLIPITIKI